MIYTTAAELAELPVGTHIRRLNQSQELFVRMVEGWRYVNFHGAYSPGYWSAEQVMETSPTGEFALLHYPGIPGIGPEDYQPILAAMESLNGIFKMLVEKGQQMRAEIGMSPAIYIEASEIIEMIESVLAARGLTQFSEFSVEDFE